MTGRERTLGEVSDDLERLARQVERLTDRLDNAPYVRLDLHNEQIQNLRAAIDSLRTMQMWMLGILASLLIAAVTTGIALIAQGF